MYHILAMEEGQLPGKKGGVSFQAAEVISRHNDSLKASEVRWDLEKKASRPFVTVERDEQLTKGECYPEILRAALERNRDEGAIDLLVQVMAPDLYANLPAISEKEIAGSLTNLSLTLQELHDRYGEAAAHVIDEVQAARQKDAEQKARKEALSREVKDAAEAHTFSFPAVRGVQAGREYYIAQIPLSVLVKLFVFDDEYVPPELRAQRTLNQTRAKGISDYIVANQDEYVLPALTASVSQEMRFDAINGGSLGMLNIPMDSTLLINDGQHRRAGIELAMDAASQLKNETIGVTIYFDEGLERSQQMFSDINSRQVKPSSAINALYDKRDPINKWLMSLLQDMPTIRRLIDFENATVGRRSKKLWSIVVFRRFVMRLTGLRDKEVPGQEVLANAGRLVQRYLETLAINLTQWDNLVSGRLVASEARDDMVIGHAVFLEALGLFGNQALLDGGVLGLQDVDELHWSKLVSLYTIDPGKSSQVWQGRCVLHGKMQKTADGVKLTAAALLSTANCPLPDQLAQLESRI
ncbi:DNA sulfur modification protein DndB [Kushneria indalinina DSM 14324]|uniref:DNA sulfur modification protein DndB n=2 Tax=Kushneria indalinina TaxID=184067 RepID=A0A3D9E0V3_9GAMM|nr:DNA sulfur modification protein DndB [Kushneria indalinina DSM 14324]